MSGEIRNIVKPQLDKFQPWLDSIPARLGDGAGNLYVVSGDRGLVWYHAGDNIGWAFNQRVQPVNDLPVLIGRTPEQPTIWQVIAVNTGQAGAVQNLAATIGQHANSHRLFANGGGTDVLYSEGMQLLPGRIFPVDGTVAIKVYPFPAEIGGVKYTIGGDTAISLVSYVPTTTGKARWVRVTVDTGGDIVTTAGDEVDIANLPDTEYPAVPDDTWLVLAAVRVYYGQVQVQSGRTNTDVVDLRWPLSYHFHTDGTGGSGDIPILDSDPISPLEGVPWILRTIDEDNSGSPIGLLLSLTTSVYTYQLSVLADGSIRRITIGSGVGGPVAWADVTGKPTEFTPSSHASTHEASGSDEIDLEAMSSGTAADGQVLTADGAGGTTFEDPPSGGVVAWDDITSKPTEFTPDAHASTHESGGADEVDITALDSGAATDGQVLTADGAGGLAFEDPPAGGAVAWDDVTGKPSVFTPDTHATSHQSGGGDAIKLDDLSAPDDNTDLDASTSAHGLMSKLSGVGTEFYNGVGGFSVPAGGGGGPLDYDTTSVSDPPTASELIAIFGDPAVVGAGYSAVLNDNGGDADVYVVASTGTNWFWAAMTKALYSTITLTPVDTFVYNTAPTTNYLSDTRFFAGNSSTQIYRGLLMPNFSAMGAGHTILTAVLRIYCIYDFSSNARNMTIHRMLTDWTPNQATWNVRKTGTNWLTAGGFNPAECEAANIGSRAFSASETLNQYKEFILDATKIQEMYDGTITNNGLMAKMETESDDMYGFSSNQGAQPLELVLEYI